MKRTTPLQCFRKPAPEAAAANRWQERNIIETENEPEGWYYPTRYRKRGRCYRNVNW